MADKIKHPPHYFRFKIEPITFIMQNDIPYAEGNAIKYICRWRHKHETKKEQLADLKKAIQCINLLPTNSKIIIIENSGNEKLKKDLESEYPKVRLFSKRIKKHKKVKSAGTYLDVFLAHSR